MCAAAGGWNLALSLTEVSMPCEAGFTGMMTRFSNADGVWETPYRTARATAPGRGRPR